MMIYKRRMIRMVADTSDATAAVRHNRRAFPYYWAESPEDPQYAATDPDLDTEHALYVPNRYTQIGWQPFIKEPEQWQNFLQQITDEKVIAGLEQGLQFYDAETDYQPHAMTVLNGILYQNVSLVVLTGVDPSTDDGTKWQPCVDQDSATYTSEVTAFATSVDTHVAEVSPANPHEDDITTIGGYTQAQIDYNFDPTNPESIAYHIADHNNPHGLTPAQAGTLPTTGGTFTGLVYIAADASMYLDENGGCLSFRNSTNTMGIINDANDLNIKGNGSAGFGTITQPDADVATDLNLTSLVDTHLPNFRAPMPLMIIDTTNALDNMGYGWDTLTADDTQVIQTGQGAFIDSTTTLDIVIGNPALNSSFGNVTVVIEGWVADSRYVFIADGAPADYTSLRSYLAFMGITATQGYLSVMTVYPSVLTTHQKAALTFDTVTAPVAGIFINGTILNGYFTPDTESNLGFGGRFRND